MKKKNISPKKPVLRRWSIGLARNASGELIAVYTRKDGTPMKSEKKRISGKVLAHAVFTGCTFAQARQKLLKQSGIAGKKAAKKSVAKEEIRKAA
jgi:hypothetical protein